MDDFQFVSFIFILSGFFLTRGTCSCAFLLEVILLSDRSDWSEAGTSSVRMWLHNCTGLVAFHVVNVCAPWDRWQDPLNWADVRKPHDSTDQRSKKSVTEKNVMLFLYCIVNVINLSSHSETDFFSSPYCSWKTLNMMCRVQDHVVLWQSVSPKRSNLFFCARLLSSFDDCLSKGQSVCRLQLATADYTSASPWNC